MKVISFFQLSQLHSIAVLFLIFFSLYFFLAIYFIFFIVVFLFCRGTAAYQSVNAHFSGSCHILTINSGRPPGTPPLPQYWQRHTLLHATLPGYGRYLHGCTISQKKIKKYRFSFVIKKYHFSFVIKKYHFSFLIKKYHFSFVRKK